MKIKGAIFDFDGTLFDSMPIWYNAGKEYLKMKGISRDDDVYIKIKTLSLKESAEYFCRHYGISGGIESIMKEINSLVEEYYFNNILPKAYVPEFLTKLKKDNVKMCIATATDKYLVEAALKRCGLEQFFLKIFSCSEVGFGKEQPVIYNKALEFLALDKADVMVFEDAFHAARTAKNAGFKVCGVFDETENEADGLKSISDKYIKTFSELL